MGKEQGIYFPNLNGLRFIAALLVIIHHIEQFKAYNQLTNYWNKIAFIGIVGKLGVVLFFVLSGFLITYLLLVEERKNEKISIKAFYLRRVLRIWPLYYLILILAFFILPHIHLFEWTNFNIDVIHSQLGIKFLLFVLFLPNLILAFFGAIPYASHTWSIGTEEQFYLAWPLLFNKIKSSRIVAMFIIIVGYILIHVFLLTKYSNFLPARQVILDFWKLFNIDCMAIGAIIALLLFNKHRFIKYLMSPYLFYVALCLISLGMYFGIYIPFIHYEIYALLFGIIILQLAANPIFSKVLEHAVLNYLGKISYGLYMFHAIGIMISIKLGIYLGINNNWFFYPFSLIFTIVLASVSYHYYEHYFLKLKSKFTIVKSIR